MSRTLLPLLLVACADLIRLGGTGVGNPGTTRLTLAWPGGLGPPTARFRWTRSRD